MKKIFLTLIAVLAVAFAANATSYTMDESALDALIESSVEVAPAAMAPASDLSSASVKLGSGSEPIVAWILSFIPVTSWLAIHRMYMGTSPLAIILNIVTGAGFGIVYVVDWVALLIGVLDGGIGQYCNNPRWWMWADII